VVGAAQECRGSITGEVTDPNSAVVAGPTVSVKNIGTSVQATTTTNRDGSYDFPVLIPAKYALSVTEQGFSAATRDGIEIRAADKMTLDVQLQTVGVTGMVTIVSGNALETGSVTTGATIERKQIVELPLSEGTAYQLATLVPGVVYAGNPQFTAPIS
jgi:hypothetical protein